MAQPIEFRISIRTPMHWGSLVHDRVRQLMRERISCSPDPEEGVVSHGLLHCYSHGILVRNCRTVTTAHFIVGTNQEIQPPLASYRPNSIAL